MANDVPDIPELTNETILTIYSRKDKSPNKSTYDTLTKMCPPWSKYTQSTLISKIVALKVWKNKQSKNSKKTLINIVLQKVFDPDVSVATFASLCPPTATELPSNVSDTRSQQSRKRLASENTSSSSSKTAKSFHTDVSELINIDIVQQNQKLEGNLQRAVDENSTLKGKVTKYSPKLVNQQRKRSRRTIDRLKSELREASLRIKTNEKRSTKSQDSLKIEKEKKKLHSNRILHMKAKMTRMARNVVKLNNDLKTLKEENSTLLTRLRDVPEIDKLKRERQDLRTDLTASDNEVASLTDKLESFVDIKTRLGDSANSRYTDVRLCVYHLLSLNVAQI